MTKLQQQLAEQFLHILEEEKLDWKKEWNGLSGRPYNPVSKTVYHGSNYFSLLLTSMAKGYQDPRWCTFAQIKEQGWTLKAGKGQSAKIEFWYPYDREQKKSISWQEFREAGGQINDRYQLYSKTYSVYNGDMIVGIPKLEVTQKEIQPVELVDTISQNMGVPISYHQTDRAFYRPVEDRIYLPYRQQFDSEYAYASTALHELSHATGSEHRLNRKQGGEFGTEPYAYEELVAEISSCFLSSELPIGQTEEHLKNHKAYVQSWIQGIKEQPEALFRAVKDAEQAAVYLEYHGGLITLEEYQTYGIEIEPASQTRDLVPKFGTEETKKVAIESTIDYKDLEFHTNRYNEKGHGREEYYRIVSLEEKGLVAPVDRTVYRDREQARITISKKAEWKEVLYEDLIQEAMKNRVERVSFLNLKQLDGWRLAKEGEHYTVYLDGERFLTGTSEKVQELNRRVGEGKHPMLQRAFTALREKQGMSLEEAAEKMYVSVPEVKAVEKGVLQLQPESLQLFCNACGVSVDALREGKVIKQASADQLKEGINKMTRQIDQLENNQIYLQGIVERYGLEASPELEEAKRKIAAYEKSIGRTESMINQASTEQILAYGKKCESYLNFGNSVDRVIHPLERTSPRREAVLVCTTPEILREVGLKDLPMHITQKHIVDCLHEKTYNNDHYHGLSVQELKRLPEALESPVILAESLTKGNSLVAVLDYREQDGNPVIVAIRPNGNAIYELRRVDSNFITSTYGKDNFSEFYQRILDQGKLLYANREKGEKLGYYLESQNSQIPEYDKILKKMALPELEQIKPKHIRRI
ncbi:zincin-like metallopeptidase domain-containing protein [Mediterraneibacter gnavus]|uniref:zincin-like metallopeptidase domain-containing protein n=1 Tax=Mediterraneibacter gnavus TaxID=33038 RepID=UPI002330600B|nr:zincin-like metallopeptidase domain-containing protein [Mediterraneibacter gnavus]MDB8703340.1 zincin-like metallopeptidase domain-containing protein [Mediterraneibacter gnavus]MDB8710744.1 zincin-like metallopeptidase domain-containing protein [Mediterraneibacter gnavus]MDB8713189.1 zincin-like metallopeptidase domain-containing protein [Mediterraneibacter gnavus]MDB8715781.1 zincin-like metallopeptidase domain-containing protein [Mediterraneibacter gnavus]